jgi:hypothetical protein
MRQMANHEMKNLSPVASDPTIAHAVRECHHLGGIVAASEGGPETEGQRWNDGASEHHCAFKKTTVKTWRYAQILGSGRAASRCFPMLWRR